MRLYPPMMGMFMFLAMSLTDPVTTFDSLSELSSTACCYGFEGTYDFREKPSSDCSNSREGGGVGRDTGGFGSYAGG